jgi:hypothetical protein
VLCVKIHVVPSHQLRIALDCVLLDIVRADDFHGTFRREALCMSAGVVGEVH